MKNRKQWTEPEWLYSFLKLSEHARQDSSFSYNMAYIQLENF